MKDEVNVSVTGDPHLTFRSVATRVDTALTTAFNITQKKMKMKLYKIQIVQQLELRDFGYLNKIL